MKKIYTVIVALCCFVAMQAQGNTGYFVEKSTARHNLNPAFAPDQGFMGVPLLGGLSFTTGGNLSLDKFFYPINGGKLGTFLHPEVSSEQALGCLADLNDLRADFSWDIVNSGWYTNWNLFGCENSFMTIDLSFKADADASIAYGLFDLLKTGMSQDPDMWNIMDASRLTASMYMQASVGLSMDVFDGLRVGAKAKLLTGLAGMDATLENLRVFLSSEQWHTGFDLDIKNTRKGVSFGVAFDLGAEYRFGSSSALDGLEVSASVTDLGFLARGQKNYVDKFISTEVDYEGMKMADYDTDVDSYVKWIWLGLLDGFEFKDRETTSMSYGPSPRVYAGAAYPLFNNLLKVGVLYNGYFSRIVPTHSVMASCGVHPWDWVDLSVSYSYTDGPRIAGHSAFGWVANFRTRGVVNVYVGSDYAFTKRNKKFIPVHTMYSDFKFGMTVPIWNFRDR
jgi:hypothetical protein